MLSFSERNGYLLDDEPADRATGLLSTSLMLGEFNSYMGKPSALTVVDLIVSLG